MGKSNTLEHGKAASSNSIGKRTHPNGGDKVKSTKLLYSLKNTQGNKS